MVIGIAVLALGVWLYRSAAVPTDAVTFTGTVVDLERTRLDLRTVVGAVVEYDHPVSGRRERLDPHNFSKDGPAIGDRVRLAYLPSKDRVRLVDAAQRRRTLLVVGGIGATMIAVQFLIWIR